MLLWIFSKELCLGLVSKEVKANITIYWSYLDRSICDIEFSDTLFKISGISIIIFVRFNLKIYMLAINMLKFSGMKFHVATYPWLKFMPNLKFCHLFWTTRYIHCRYIIRIFLYKTLYQVFVRSYYVSAPAHLHSKTISNLKYHRGHFLSCKFE